MRKFIAGMSVGLALAAAPALADREYRLQMKDVVEILADYDVSHVPIPPIHVGEGKYYMQLGSTVYKPAKININPMANEETRRLATIHEFYHALMHRRGVENHSEAQVNILAREHYKWMYGEWKEPDDMSRIIDKKFR